MSCCADLATVDVALAHADPDRQRRREELTHAARKLEGGDSEVVFSAPAIHCGACMAAIEDALSQQEGVQNVRVNLTLKRITVRLAPETDPVTIAERLDALGYPATVLDLGDLNDLATHRRSSELLKALAVAGFASANVMLLSVSVWSGADAATRDIFHLVSALIAVPAIGYSGRIFFRSALTALRAGRLNMDVPISLAILLATGMSLGETLTHGESAYFDAALTLTFFLLIGRTLDERMRERARSAVTTLARLSAKGATVLEEGEARYMPLDEIEPGMRLSLTAGERLAVDGILVSTTASLDRSLVTGESDPVAAEAGTALEAGVVNLGGPIEVTATKRADASFFAEIQRMMTAAEAGRGRRSRIADEVARIYAPAVHIVAAVTFLGWMIAGYGCYAATYAAISVLIVTCPCALGLAVPVVHVVAASRLFENGILMKDGGGLEKLAGVTRAIFDKTGTLTTGQPAVARCEIAEEETGLALSLARASSHPASKALAYHLRGVSPANAKDIRELPGLGLEGRFNDQRIRLGQADWVSGIAICQSDRPTSGLAFAFEGKPLRPITLTEQLRPEARETIAALQAEGIACEILSGDAEPQVARIAANLALPSTAGQTPQDKMAAIAARQAKGERVLMVGDGLNDAPSLAAGDVSMAPASACDVGRLAADFVFTREGLSSVAIALRIARRSRRLVNQNFGLAFAYNVIAVPLAMAGFLTPLLAAIAMSLSSILVVANSLRLAAPGHRQIVRANGREKVSRSERGLGEFGAPA
ncbi:heavy metal translocating P-type ATPase [Fulvimarina sp. MAC8]|uniref:heavy metal translocating P-type ATPase n=1 Tax=Fulvimarina sp. MAC8 TaxID=3162874 RepID=UPI0032EF988B